MGYRCNIVQIRDKYAVRIRKTFFGYDIPSSTEFLDKNLPHFWSDPRQVLEYCLFDDFEKAEQAKDWFEAANCHFKAYN